MFLTSQACLVLTESGLYVPYESGLLGLDGVRPAWSQWSHACLVSTESGLLGLNGVMPAWSRRSQACLVSMESGLLGLDEVRPACSAAGVETQPWIQIPWGLR